MDLHDPSPFSEETKLVNVKPPMDISMRVTRVQYAVEEAFESRKLSGMSTDSRNGATLGHR